MTRKAHWERSHSRIRAAERYGLSASDVAEMGKMIRAGRSRPVRKQSLRVTHHDVEYQDQTVRVVYDKTRQQIITVLPPLTGKP